MGEGGYEARQQFWGPTAQAVLGTKPEVTVQCWELSVSPPELSV